MGISKELVAFVELGVYFPIFIATSIIVLRLGFRRQQGWIYLAIFCLIRLAGAGFEIDSHKNPQAKTPLEWALILQSVGLSPLLLSSLGLLKRVLDQTSDHVPSSAAGKPSAFATLAPSLPLSKLLTKRATANSRRSRLIQILLLPCTIALVLCILGGMDETSSNISEHASGKTKFRVGIGMFLAIYLFLFILTTTAFREWAKVPRDERRTLVAVLAALPFIAVRLMYGLISVFSTLRQFSLEDSSILIQLAMATVEEFIVVIIYTVVGFSVHKNHSQPQKGGAEAAYNLQGATGTSYSACPRPYTVPGRRY